MADKKDEVVLSIRNMSKSFGRNRVLDHINLDLKKERLWDLWAKTAQVSQQ
jgi:monosaccharide ABC transporter ATP-binding protein, CUT2 family (TC 3.A.1.2.-)